MVVMKNNVPRIIFGSIREEAKERWTKLQNEKFRNLHTSPGASLLCSLVNEEYVEFGNWIVWHLI